MISSLSVVGIFHADDLVVSQQLSKIFVSELQLVVVESTLIGDLVRDELSVMSSKQGLVNLLLLLNVFHHVCENKLGHFDVIGKQVQRQVNTLGNGHELMFLLVLSWLLHAQRVLCVTTS